MPEPIRRAGPLASVLILLLSAFAVLPAPVATQPATTTALTVVNGREAVENEVLVKLKPESAYLQGELAAAADADRSEPVGGTGIRRMHSRLFTAEEMVAYLDGHPDIEFIEPNYALRATVLPNDPSFGSLWGLLNTGQTGGTSGVDIDAPSAWNVTTGTRTVVVGIVDTGIEYTHPDLAANVWSAPSSFTVTIGGRSITCGAGTHGFNAIANTCDPMDDNNHGTHVSGTIGAAGNNGRGVAGVNWVTSLMGLKFLDANGSGYTSNALNAIEFAVQAKARFGASANVRVLNNSWGGGGFSQALLDEIRAANAAEMLFAAAAGNSHSDNDATPSYPSGYNSSNIIGVAATDSRDALAAFSSYGRTTVHLAAPGVAILSTVRGGGYASFQGTSMATPHVAGAAALVLAACPSLTTAALKTTILNSVDLVAGLSSVTSTGGRLNVAAAVQRCTGSRVSSVTLGSDVASPQNTGTTIRFTATATGGTAPLAYRWWVTSGGSWTLLRDWGAGSTYDWTPSTASAGYRIAVNARSSGAMDTEAAANVGYVIALPALTVSVTPSVASPRPAGTTIRLTAAGSGGTLYDYRWYLSTNSGSSWTLLRDWNATATYDWTPATAGTGYRFAVNVRSRGGTASQGTTSLAYTITAPAPVTAVAVAANPASPQVRGTTIRLTATPTGGVGPVQYRWWVSTGGNWTLLRNWSATTTYDWKPLVASAGYVIAVNARSAGAVDTNASVRLPYVVR